MQWDLCTTEHIRSEFWQFTQFFQHTCGKKKFLSLQPVHIKTSTSPSVPVLQCPQPSLPVGGSGAATTSFQQWLILPMKMSTRGKLIRRISTSHSGVWSQGKEDHLVGEALAFLGCFASLRGCFKHAASNPDTSVGRSVCVFDSTKILFLWVVRKGRPSPFCR